MYIRFPLSLRNLEYPLHELGVDISHETVRCCWSRSGPKFAAENAKLNKQLFPNLRNARHLMAARRDDYNHRRPHAFLEGFAQQEYQHRSGKNQSLSRANQ